MTEMRHPASRPADDYRRAARRLRATLGHDRPRLYRSLQSLSARRLQPAEPAEGPASRYATLITQSLDGTVLRYSERQKLLRVAKHFNIDRFEANLLIAAVQHRIKAVQAKSEAAAPANPWVLALGLFIAVQSVIAFAIWKLMST
jgi:hypothetical protein